MHIKTFTLCFILGLGSLLLASCSDHDGGHGHSHTPVSEQAPANNTHDNIDSK